MQDIFFAVITGWIIYYNFNLVLEWAFYVG
jgi:hypothetical protein